MQHPHRSPPAPQLSPRYTSHLHTPVSPAPSHPSKPSWPLITESYVGPGRVTSGTEMQLSMGGWAWGLLPSPSGALTQPRTHWRRPAPLSPFLSGHEAIVNPTQPSLNGSQDLSAPEMFCASLGNAAWCCLSWTVTVHTSKALTSPVVQNWPPDFLYVRVPQASLPIHRASSSLPCTEEGRNLWLPLSASDPPTHRPGSHSGHQGSLPSGAKAYQAVSPGPSLASPHHLLPGSC